MKKRYLLIGLTVLIVLILCGCRLKIDDVTIKCNPITGECTVKGADGGDEEPSQGGGGDDPTEPVSPDKIGLVTNALKYAGYTREMFKPVAKKYGYTITDETSWCAMFVSTMIKEVGLTDMKKYTSASVSTFMSAMVKDGRFYHSKYWYEKSGNFKDPLGGPQPGDIVFFTKESCAKSKYKGDGKLPNKTSDCYRHIGIIVSATSSKITYVHGNTSGCKTFRGNGVCGNSTKEIGSAYIIGYGR